MLPEPDQESPLRGVTEGIAVRIRLEGQAKSQDGDHARKGVDGYATRLCMLDPTEGRLGQLGSSGNPGLRETRGKPSVPDLNAD